MGSPTLFANPFSMCSNYLLSPKPGEKRSFFSTKVLSRNQPRTNSVPYAVSLIEIELQDPPLQISMGNTYMSKYSGKLPFQAPVPPMKMPSLIGRYVGAKSQSAREESKLCDILGPGRADSLTVLANNLRNFPINEEFSSKLNIMHNFDYKDNPHKGTINGTTYVNPFQEVANTKHEMAVHPSKVELKKTLPVIQVDTAGKSMGQEDLQIQCKTSVMKECNALDRDDKGKPPMKKQKLNLKTCRSSRKKHKGRKKKCVKKVQSDSPAVSPGYDPMHSTFETLDEVDCCIELSNRFSPLENISACHWSDLDSSEAPLLDMLSEMHLDDFSVELNSASPTVELFNMCSYEKTESCNSSIAFILGGNDDILTSDSEDGSFASDFDDLHWQSFKTDFEFFQDQIPLHNVISCGLSEVHFETNLEILDDDIFLNDLEYHPTCDAEQRLRDINFRWNQAIGCGDEAHHPTKVCFAPEDCLTSVHYIPSGPEECQARKGPWDQCYLDRCRFERRIQEVEPIISLCLAPQHRKSVFQRLYGCDN